MRDALASLPGVANVQVDFGSQTATVTYDPAKFQPEQGLQKLAEANYDQCVIRK